MVLRRILLLNDGRDKILKVLQYSAKAVLYLNILERLMRYNASHSQRVVLSALNASAATRPTPTSTSSTSVVTAAATTDLVKSRRIRLEKLTSHFSQARKIVRLFHALEGVQTLADLVRAPVTHPTLDYTYDFLSAVVGIVNDICDDAICLAKMGMLL